MKTSQLIDKLEYFRQMEGDVDVIIRGDFGISDLSDSGIYVDHSHADEEPFIAIDVADEYQK